MGRKYKWYKMYSADLLGDAKVRQLTIKEIGILFITCNLLHSQTDEPGRFITNGKPWSEPEIIDTILRASSRDHTPILCVSSWYHQLHHTGILQIDDKGVHYSPRIVKDFEIAKARAEAGRIRQHGLVTKTQEESLDLVTKQNTFAALDEDEDIDKDVRTSQPRPTERSINSYTQDPKKEDTPTRSTSRSWTKPGDVLPQIMDRLLAGLPPQPDPKG